MSEKDWTPLRTLGDCPSCSRELLPQARYCCYCGSRVAYDGWLLRLVIKFVFMNLIIGIGCFGFVLAFSGWGLVFSILISALCAVSLRALGERLG